MADANPPDHVGPLLAVRDLPGACLLSRRTAQALLDDDCLNGKVTF